MVGGLAAIALGVVLLLSGLAKRADPEWRAKAVALGAPAWSIPVLPWFELVLGAVLISGFAQPVAATVAGLVLVAFTVLLVVRLAQGRRPPCACFGARSARPIGPWSLGRNAVLLALAAVAIFS